MTEARTIPPLRLFFDTDALLAGAASTRGAAHLLLRLAELGLLDVVTCDYVRDEAVRNVGRKLPAAAPTLASLLDQVVLVIPTPMTDIVDAGFGVHPKDAPVWAAFLYEHDEDALYVNFVAPGADGWRDGLRAYFHKNALYREWLRKEAKIRGRLTVAARPWDTLVDRILAASGLSKCYSRTSYWVRTSRLRQWQRYAGPVAAPAGPAFDLGCWPGSGKREASHRGAIGHSPVRTEA